MNVLTEKNPDSRARVLHCTDIDYHRDPCEEPSLSHSIAHTLVSESAAHAWMRHPRFGDRQRDPTDAQIEGTLLHKMILGKGPDVVLIAADSYRTKVAQLMRRDALESGSVPVLEHKYDAMCRTAAVLREHCEAKGYVFDGISEAAIEWREGDVLCRCRIDHVKRSANGFLLLDLKRLRSCNPHAVSRACYEYGYDIQAAAYQRAVRALMRNGEEPPGTEFVFLVCEAEEPHSVVPIRLDSSYERLGNFRWGQAVALWEKCLRSDLWPSYEETVISPPPWAAWQMEGAENASE